MSTIDVAAKLAAFRAKQEEAERLAAEKAAEKERLAIEKAEKAAKRQAAEKALITAALESAENAAPLSVSEYAALEPVKLAEMSETTVKAFLDKWAADAEVPAEAVVTGKARTGTWNGRFDLAVMLDGLSRPATGSRPATWNQVLGRLSTGQVPNDPRSTSDQIEQYRELEAIRSEVSDAEWGKVIALLERTFAAAKERVETKAAASQEAAAA